MKHGMNTIELIKYCFEVDRNPSEYELWVAGLLDRAESPHGFHVIIKDAVRQAVDQLGGNLE